MKGKKKKAIKVKEDIFITNSIQALYGTCPPIWAYSILSISFILILFLLFVYGN